MKVYTLPVIAVIAFLIAVGVIGFLLEVESREMLTTECMKLGYEDHKYMNEEHYCLNSSGEALRIMIDYGDFWDITDMKVVPLILYDYRSREDSGK